MSNNIATTSSTTYPLCNGEELVQEIRIKLLKAKITEAIKMQHWYDDVISGKIIRDSQK